MKLGRSSAALRRRPALRMAHGPRARASHACVAHAHAARTATVTRAPRGADAAASEHRVYAVGQVLKDVGYTVVGSDNVMASMDAASMDLQELCSLQLQALFAILARFSRSKDDFSASVYCRSPSSLQTGSLTLQRVARWPPAPKATLASQQSPGGGGGGGGGQGFAPAGVVALAEEQLVLQEGGAEGDADSTEAKLVCEDVVALPNSATLVFPLSEAGFLVGMLVVEHDPAGGLPTTASHSTVQVPFNDAELFVVRTMVPSLAKACAMDLRTALTNAAHTTRTHLARTLLREARGPLSALQTFGSMLVPRLDDGEPDKDMAEGMMMQSKRLQEVVAQLEAALKPHPPSLAAGAGVAGGRQLALPPPGAAGPFVEARAGGAQPPGSPGRSSGDGDAAAGGRADAAAAPAAAPIGETVWGPRPLLPPALSSSTLASSSSSIRSASLTGDSSWRPGSPRDTASDPAGTSSTTYLGSAPHRQPAAEGRAPSDTIDLDLGSDNVATPVPRPGGLPGPGGSSSSSSAPRSAGAGEASSSSGGGASMGGDRAASEQLASTSGRQVPVVIAAQCRGRSSVVEALANLLSASRKVAKLLDVTLVIHHPLREALEALPPPVARGGAGSGGSSVRRGAGSSSGSSGGSGSRSSSSSSRATAAGAPAAAAPQLLPRPLQRPLVAGVRGEAVARVMGYLLDLALQSTPAGGQVAVNARPGRDGGVELLLRHTGHLHPDRMHPASGGIAAAAAAEAAARSGMVSLDLAQAQVQDCGGVLTTSYPVEVGSAGSLGTSIVVWLPGPTLGS